MKVLVTSDLHLPLNYKEVLNSFREVNEEIDIAILAGDIVDSYNFIYLRKIYEIILEKFGNIEIFATFGNNEASIFLNDKNKEYLKKEYNFINWLDYEYVDLGDYYLLGFQGFPDRTWKLSDISNLKNYYYNKLSDIFNNINKKTILFSHYGLIKETVFGDPAPSWSLYSEKIQELITKYIDKIKIAFHGHAHYARMYKYKIDDVEIYNVSFYIHKKPLIFEL